MSSLKLPTVLITGCSQGTIGHYLAIAFSSHGYHVFASARRLSAMEALRDVPNVTLLELDITSTASVQAAHDLIAATTGGTLDILYHNAGVRAVVMATSTDKKMADWIMGANFTAVVGMTTVFTDLLLKAGVGSKIAFTSSISGRVPAPSNAVYNSSKAALDMYADVLRLEMEPLGVHVVTVVTGTVETTMAVQKLEPLPKDSPYKAIESIINDAWTEGSGIMPASQYAEVVVNLVIQKQPPKQIWAGNNASTVWWIESLGLSWILPFILRRQYGLNKLSPGKREGV